MSDHYQIVCLLDVDETMVSNVAHRVANHLRERGIVGRRQPYPYERDPSDSDEQMHADIDEAVSRSFGGALRPHKPVTFVAGTSARARSPHRSA